MNFQEINKKLLDLYSNNYPKLTEALNEKNKSLKHKDRATNPLLLKIDGNYANAKLKIMVFGQETNTWLGEKNNAEFLGEIEPVYNLYQDFFLSDNCYSYGGQFWNGVSRFIQLTEKETESKVGIVWNNVFKIGKCGINKPCSSIQEIQFQYFNVIQKEIEILKPGLLVFFSGPNYDGHIKKVFGKLGRKPINGFTERQLCELEVSDTIPSYRTYHPNYLWRKDINKYLEPIISRIKTMHNNVYKT